MRAALLLLFIPLAGCIGGDAATTCSFDGETTWYMHELGFMDATPPEGATPGNGFQEAFLSNDMDEWRSARIPETLRLQGNVTLEYWAENRNTAAPVVVGGDPGDGYHFFNQFGTGGGFVPSYHTEYAEVLPGTAIHHYVEVFEMPPGGLLVEAGDRIRLLLTSLAMDDADGAGHTILTGGSTPSAITFTATCEPTPTWQDASTNTTPIALPFHQGLLTGGVPATDGINQAHVGFELRPDTDRLQVRVRETGPSAAKNDIDLTILNEVGEEVWSVGSPYTDEKGTLHRANLDALMPPGNYVVRVDSYSGHGYQGELEILQAVQG